MIFQGFFFGRVSIPCFLFTFAMSALSILLHVQLLPQVVAATTGRAATAAVNSGSERGMGINFLFSTSFLIGLGGILLVFGPKASGQH